MKYLIKFLVCAGLFLSYSCDPNKGVYHQTKEQSEELSTGKEINANEEYVMVTTFVNFPMYVNHDQAAFHAWGRSRGVKTTVLGPTEWDVVQQIATIEQVIPSKPTGLLINGTDPSLASAIDKAVDAGIPTVVYDSEIPGSKRHAFLGTDWYDIGRLQGEALVELIGGKGKIAYIGLVGQVNMENGFQGLLDVIEKYPDIEVLGKYDSQGSTEHVAKITADLIAANPDLAGLCGFDATTGPGLGLAVKRSWQGGTN